MSPPFPLSFTKMHYHSARTRAHTRALDNARDYLRLGIFKPERLKALIRRLKSLDSNSINYRSITRIWIDGIGLDEDLLAISKGETDALNNYLYSIELMMHCKKAAVRVSPSVWAGIESRILTVSSD
jgi:hypothetical protein